MLITTYVLAQEAVCQCSTQEIRAKESLSDSLKNSNIVFQGVVEDLIMIDAYNYIAKIKQKKIFHYDTTLDAPVAAQDQNSGLITKIIGSGGSLFQNTAAPEPSNFVAQQYLFALSSYNPEECSLDLAVGWEYLIYGTLSGNVINVSECTRTAPIGERQDDIQELTKALDHNNKTAVLPAN